MAVAPGANQSRTVTVWNIADAKAVLTFPIRSDTSESMRTRGPDDTPSFSPDGTRLVVCSGGNVRVFDMTTGKLAATLNNTDPVSSFQFNTDGRRFATAAGATARVWDLGKGAGDGPPSYVMRGHTGDVTSLAFPPDGSRMYTAGMDGAVKIWDISTRDQPVTIDQVGRLGFAFRAAAQRLVVIDLDVPPSNPRVSKVTVWDSAGKRVAGYPGPTPPVSNSSLLWQLALSADGARLAIVVPLGTLTKPEGAELQVLNSGTGKPLFTHKELGPGPWRDALVFSTDGTRLAWGHTLKGKVRVFDASNGTELHAIDISAGEGSGMTLSPDGHYVAAIPGPRWTARPEAVTGHIWDVLTGTERVKLEPFESGVAVNVTELVYSPDGTRLAALFQARGIGPASTGGSSASQAVIWDTASGRKLLTLRGHSNIFLHLAFSPDGHRIATAMSKQSAFPTRSVFGREIKLWDTATGNDLMTLKDADRLDVEHLEFIADGNRLYAAGRIGTGPPRQIEIRTWDATPRPGK